MEMLIPRSVRNHSEVRPQQWLNRIHDKMMETKQLNPIECKARFIGNRRTRLEPDVAPR